MSQECSPLPACLRLRKGWTGGQIRGPCPAPCQAALPSGLPGSPSPLCQALGNAPLDCSSQIPPDPPCCYSFCFPSTTGRNVCLSKVSTHTLQLLLQRFTFFLRAANSVFQAWFEDITKQTETKRMKIFFLIIAMYSFVSCHCFPVFECILLETGSIKSLPVAYHPLS